MSYIYSKCIYDADEHYIEIKIQKVNYPTSYFLLETLDTSKENDSRIEILLERNEVENIVKRLSDFLKNNE